MYKLLPFFMLFFIWGCDSKDQAEYVAKSAYNELELKYKKLTIEHKILRSKNIKLTNQNKLLKHDLEKYMNGFKSMYE